MAKRKAPPSKPAASDMEGVSLVNEPPAKKPRITKLAPARPWPRVPTAFSATAPRSARAQGNNYICVTRKTSLGAYMRRCKDLVDKNGHRTIHLSAMGAAIPLLAQIVAAVPPILSYPVKTHVTTGTVEVQDEIMPEDEEKDDITFRERNKSSMCVVLSIDCPAGAEASPLPRRHSMKGMKRPSSRKRRPQPAPTTIQPPNATGRSVQIFQEPEPLDE